MTNFNTNTNASDSASAAQSYASLPASTDNTTNNPLSQQAASLYVPPRIQESTTPHLNTHATTETLADCSQQSRLQAVSELCQKLNVELSREEIEKTHQVTQKNSSIYQYPTGGFLYPIEQSGLYRAIACDRISDEYLASVIDAVDLTPFVHEKLPHKPGKPYGQLAALLGLTSKCRGANRVLFNRVSDAVRRTCNELNCKESSTATFKVLRHQLEKRADQKEVIYMGTKGLALPAFILAQTMSGKTFTEASMEVMKDHDNRDQTSKQIRSIERIGTERESFL